MCGTAFLVAKGEATWLVTCAHNISQIDDTPPDTGYFEGGRISVVGTAVSIPMFDENGKRFSVVLNEQYGRLVDAMTIKLQPNEADALARYGAYSLEEIVSPTQGEAVTTYGFPGMKAALIDARSSDAEITQVAGANFKMSKPSEKGYSGGPVTSSAGLVGIATGDVGHEGTMTNALAVRLDLVKASLFQ
jgi:hypothetical protein